MNKIIKRAMVTLNLANKMTTFLQRQVECFQSSGK